LADQVATRARDSHPRGPQTVNEVAMGS
jgi:hypothetical protein